MGPIPPRQSHQTIRNGPRFPQPQHRRGLTRYKRVSIHMLQCYGKGLPKGARQNNGLDQLVEVSEQDEVAVLGEKRLDSTDS